MAKSAGKLLHTTGRYRFGAVCVSAVSPGLLALLDAPQPSTTRTAHKDMCIKAQRDLLRSHGDRSAKARATPGTSPGPPPTSNLSDHTNGMQRSQKPKTEAEGKGANRDPNASPNLIGHSSFFF